MKRKTKHHESTYASQIEEAITEHWGPRCAVIYPNCCVCSAWAEYDSLIALQRENRALVRMLKKVGEEIMFDATPDDETNVCCKCDSPYTLRVLEEPTVLCDSCAQSVVADIARLLKRTKRGRTK